MAANLQTANSAIIYELCNNLIQYKHERLYMLEISIGTGIDCKKPVSQSEPVEIKIESIFHIDDLSCLFVILPEE